MKYFSVLVFLVFGVTAVIAGQQSQPSSSSPTSEDQRAIDQLREVAEAIKSCPESKIMMDDGSGWNEGSPFNVIWDIGENPPLHSHQIGYIEYIKHSSYIQAPQESCKKRDRACNRRNEINHQMYLTMITTNSPDQFRFEFDLGPEGIEFRRALMKRESEDNTHWIAFQLGKSCESSAVSMLTEQK